MLKDQLITRAVSNIAPRAERPDDPDIIVSTFVDTGAIAQLDNGSNQILFGRRGSGKTHVLRVLSEGANGERLPVYIDCRRLGSSGDASADTSLRVRGASVFRDIARAIFDVLLNYATLLDDAKQEDTALDALGQLHDTWFEIRYEPPARIEAEVSRQNGDVVSASASLDLSLNPSAKIAGTVGGEGGVEAITRFSVDGSLSLRFAEADRALTRVLDATNIHQLLVLIDEWAEIDSAVQPYVAEFLKKAFSR